MGLFDRVKLTSDVVPCFFCNMPVDQKYYYSIKLMREDDENLNNYDDKVEVSPEGMRFIPYPNSVMPKKILRLDEMPNREEIFNRIGVIELKHHEECLDFRQVARKYPDYVVVATNLRADSKELIKRKKKADKNR